MLVERKKQLNAQCTVSTFRQIASTCFGRIYSPSSGSILWWGSLRERDLWGDPDVDGRIILRWIFRKWERGCGDWMELAQDRDRRRAFVSKVMNFRVP
jgi:hypothetical protein